MCEFCNPPVTAGDKEEGLGGNKREGPAGTRVRTRNCMALAMEEGSRAGGGVGVSQEVNM